MTDLRADRAEALKGHAAMLTFAVAVAGSFALGGMVANDISPLALNALRFWIAAAVMLSVVAATGGMAAADARAPWRYLALGGLLAIYFGTMFEGLKTAAPVSSAAVFTLTPVMSAGFGWLLMRQVPTARIGLALGIGAAGALWVIFRADWAAFTAFEVGRGEAIFFLGCIAHAAYAPLSARLNRGSRPVVFTLGILVATATVLTIAGWGAIRATDWAALRPLVWITILYTALPATALTVLMVQFATLRIPSSKVMAYTYLTPSVVLIWQAALGQGVPPALVLGGVGLSVVALALLLRGDHSAGA